MNILVTGGAGYIGSQTCKELALAGHRVVVYDNLATGWRDLVKWGDFIHGDIRDAAKLGTALRKHRIEGVIHFAALSCVGDSVIDPGSYYANNVSGTLCLLETMRDLGVPRIVMSGTCAVYGLPERQPIVEDTPADPVNPYGATKLMMERMLADFETAHALGWMSLRYFNAAGGDPEGETGERHIPESHLIPRVLMAASAELSGLDIYGEDYDTPDGTCIRDYVHVKDLARAHVRAVEHLERGGASDALNLGTGTGLSVREIVRACESRTGKSIPVTVKSRRPGDATMLTADAGRALAVLGWKPEYSSLDHIIGSAWDWLQKDATSRRKV